MSRFARLLVLLGAAVTACTSEPVAPAGGGPGAGRPGGDSTGGPTFVQASAGAPSIANPVVSFWARLGDNRSATMMYHAAAGQKDSSQFMSFRVPNNALYARPDGTLFQEGDSVLITVTLSDPVHLVLDFQPSGLRFSPDHPAELKLSFAEVNPDLDGDGVVTRADSALAAGLHLWRREGSTSPWEAQPSICSVSAEEVEGKVSGFSSYGIAY